MKKPVCILLVLSLCMLSTATLVAARSRHYDHGYSNYYRGYHYSHHYRPHRHSYHAGSYLPLIGVGLLAGAVVGSMIYEPPRHQTIVYSTPPPIVIQSEPMVINKPNDSVQPPELVLRQVKITEQIVNVRSGPGLDSAIIGQTVAGQTLDVIGAAPEWLYVRTGEGQYGWVMSQYTTESGGPVG